MAELAIPLLIVGAASVGATAYSANQERKSAEKVANVQKEIADKQIKATAEQENLAATTAKTKLKAARARQTKTILTKPDLEEPNVNLKSAMGV